MRYHEDYLFARFMRYRRPRDFARLFDQTAPALLKRARQIDAERAAELVRRTYEAVLLGQECDSYHPGRRAVSFLQEILLRIGVGLDVRRPTAPGGVPHSAVVRDAVHGHEVGDRAGSKVEARPGRG